MTSSTTPPATTLPRLSRSAGDGRPAAPVRTLHLGLGNFFRAHQAWYTEHAPEAADWGIAAFTGRDSELVDDLRPQDGLYTLIVRDPDGDRFEVVSSVSEVRQGTDHDAWLRLARSPGLALITLTVTEAGYVRGPDGGLDTSDPVVAADVDALRADVEAPVLSAPARVLAALLARQRAGLGRIAVVSCDNLPHNGEVARRVVTDAAAAVDPGLAGVVEATAAFVTTMVDRITPRPSAADREAVAAATGRADAAPVATEPFSEWVLSGEFPAGRPGWEHAGAAIVDDIAPFEQRKLYLLNGSHSLLAYAGSIRGHETVAQAIADPTCRQWVEEWWDEASRHLPFPADAVAAYRTALVERFSNPGVRHLLAQIAADGSQKLPVRILPTVRAERAAGRVPHGAARVLAAWVRHLQGRGAPVTDPLADTAVESAQGDRDQAVRRVLGLLDPSLTDDQVLVDAVVERLADLGG